MKRITLVFCILFFGITLMSSTTNEGENNILPYPILQHKMANGLNVVTVPFDSPGIAAFYIIVRVGSRDEVEKGKSGFAHFFEHMMFRGTDKYSKHEYSEVLKGIGASANANTSNDRTVYHMTGNASMLEKMFEIESDRFMNLNYSVQDFKTEAGAVKGEYTKNYASPYMQIYEKMRATAFTSHTYSHTTMGFLEDIVDMPNQYEYSLEFFKRFYRPEYCTILVVGDVKNTEVNALAEKYFGTWKRGDFVSKVPAEPKQTETRHAHIQVPNFPPYLDLNFKGPAFSDKEIDMPALDVLSSVFFSEKSALYKKLVIDEQKVRFIGGGASDSRDPYLFGISASVVNPDDLQYVKNEIMKTLDKAKTIPVDAKELETTKSHLKYSFAMRIDSPDAIANSLANYIWITGDPESLNRTYKNYEKVTAEDIMMVAKKYFTPETLTIGTISPNEEGGIQ